LLVIIEICTTSGPFRRADPPIAIGAMLLQPRYCRWACPDEGRDKDRKSIVYLPALLRRSSAKAQQAGSKARLYSSSWGTSLRAQRSTAD